MKVSEKRGGVRAGAGRKKMLDGDKLVTRSFALPDSVWIVIEREAVRRGVSKGAVVRQILEDGVKRIQKEGA